MELFIEKESSPKADKIAEELGWERGSDYPVWGHTEIYLKTISKGYCMLGETPKDAYWRVATTIAKRLRNVYCAKSYSMKRAAGIRSDDPSIGSSSRPAKNLKVRSIRWYAHQNVKRNLPHGNVLCAK